MTKRAAARIAYVNSLEKVDPFSPGYLAELLALPEIATAQGYVLTYAPRHPNCHNTGHVPRHRLVMEAKIGRYLQPGETVHHLNGVRNDNREANLELWQSAQKPGIRNADAINWASDILGRNRPAKLTATDLAM